jgi:hypothetical protein
MAVNWRDNPDAVARLIACSTDQLEREFPGVPRKTLINRRAEFRNRLEYVPERNHASGDTIKTVERPDVKDEELAVVPKALFEQVLRERDAAKEKLRRYRGPHTKSSAQGARPLARAEDRNNDRQVSSAYDGTVHVVIPDTQAKPGVPTDHLNWIGQYIVDHLSGRPNVKILHLGDHADMPSLSSYDKGRKSMEGRRVAADIDSANEAFEILNSALIESNLGKKADRQWWPERYILLGNHEDRITRATEADAQLDGLLSLDSLNYEDLGWHVQPFLKPLFLDGVGYAHFWANPMTGRPYGGQAITRLKTLGFSYTMGHQQLLDYAVRFAAGQSQHALIAGSAYLHNEDYKGFQGNSHWRGIIVCHDVRNGQYDPMLVSLDYLCRRYEGMSIERFVKKKYKFDYMGSDAWR